MIDALAADRACIVDLDAQIQDLEHTLAVLQSQRALAQERLDSYKYPVLTLPNEIVCEIFIHFLPVYPSCPPLAGSRSPILLTHICAGWRKIALAFPALWRAIEIPSCNNPDCLASTLGQSGFCPLSINVDGYGGWDNVGLVLAAILPHRARWEYLSLRLADNDYLDIGGPMPLLQHLDLEFETNSDLPKYSFVEAPLLRTAILNDDAVVRVVLPWAQLTSLTLNTMYVHECVPVLQQAANLTHCELELYDDFDETRASEEAVVTLPSLQSLTLHDPTPKPGHVKHLPTFIVPALCSLKISERFLGPGPIDSLSSFISKSGCNLRLQRVQIVGQRSVLKESYCTAFPSIQMFFVGSYVGDGVDSAGDS
ncbi:hypothetical protein DFH08DRAFT_1038550 [Mycena albidolilacea]|uniref:F-box domain-containing protein n=1 Tax=Mycena albidolilacea TaxID=1033008 RepID=A0AAD7AIB5_9AGAR|nr:hypothetical protein DFH08DRAFT_1038550 [Mycena albidolilacea]